MGSDTHLTGFGDTIFPCSSGRQPAVAEWTPGKVVLTLMVSRTEILSGLDFEFDNGYLTLSINCQHHGIVSRS